MQDFPANSARARSQSDRARPEEQPTIERVVSGEAVHRKRGLGRQFKDTFIAGSARMAFDYILLEVVVPQIQEMMLDALHGGTEKYIRGDSRSRRSRSPGPYSSHPGQVNYQGMSGNRPNTTRTLSQQARSRHDFGDILIPSLQEAEDVIDRMYDVLARYGSVDVAALYSLTGIQVSHTDKKWGWTSLAGARAIRQRNGSYLLDLPAPEPLG